MSQTDLRAVTQALNAAEASLRLAKQLIGGGRDRPGREERDFSHLPSIDGTFDGTHMAAADGKRYEVSINYATKSQLVYGDKLKMYDDHGKPWFKQIDKVKRDQAKGMLTQKAGSWHVVTPDGSYKVSPEAVAFLGYKVDEEVNILLPKDNKRVPFATLEFDPQRKVGEDRKEPTLDRQPLKNEPFVAKTLEVKEPEPKAEEKKVTSVKEAAPKEKEPASKTSPKPKAVKSVETKKEAEVLKELPKPKVEEKVVLEEDDLR